MYTDVYIYVYIIIFTRHSCRHIAAGFAYSKIECVGLPYQGLPRVPGECSPPNMCRAGRTAHRPQWRARLPLCPANRGGKGVCTYGGQRDAGSNMVVAVAGEGRGGPDAP